MTTWITVCDTCRVDRTQAVEPTAGTTLAVAIEGVERPAEVKVRRVSCLMGCGHGCNVAIQASGKLAYTLGSFSPDAGAAEAIVAYATLHAESATGQVPYRQWPDGVKGHFVTRHPPLPDDGAAARDETR